MGRFSDNFPDITKPDATPKNSHRPPTDDQWDFYLACVFGHDPTLRRILAKSPDIDGTIFYDFPLLMAVRQGHADTVRLLLDETGGRVDGATPTGNVWYSRCIDTAKSRGFAAICEMLVEHRIKTDHLASSAAENIYEMLRGPLSSGDLSAAERIIKANPQLVNTSPDGQREIFAWAYRAEIEDAMRVEQLRLLIDHGIDPNCGPFIHDAAEANNLPIAGLLLAQGADPNTVVDSCSNCMWIARFSNPENYEEMQALLASYGGRMPLDNGFEDVSTASLLDADQKTRDMLDESGELLSSVIHNDDVELLDRYVELMGNVRIETTAPNRGAFSPRSIAMLERLVDHGLNVNQRDWRGRPFLFCHDTIEWLSGCLRKGACINAVEFIDCSTPLGRAACQNDLEVAKFLLENGAERNLPREHEWAQPLSVAMKKGHSNMVSLLQCDDR